MGVQINGDTGNISATKADYSGNVTIGGTLTYEDVTNIDSVGLVTARSGIEVGARPGVAASISVDGNAIFSGITTIGGNVKVGTGITLSPDGNAFHTGVVTATSFVGGLPITSGADNRVITASSSSAIQGETNLVFTGTRLGINQTTPAPLSGGGTGLIHIAASDNPEVVLERTASGTEAKASIRVTDGEDFKIAVKDGSGSTIDALAIDTGTGYVTMPNRPMFDATVTSGAISSDNTIVFNQADLNVGSHYDTSNGRFTAPVTGYYFLFYGGLKDNTSAITRIKPRKNGNTFIHNREIRLDDGDTFAENGAMNLICSLTANDYVEIRVTAGTVYGGSSGYTYFGGYLLA